MYTEKSKGERCINCSRKTSRYLLFYIFMYWVENIWVLMSTVGAFIFTMWILLILSSTTCNRSQIISSPHLPDSLSSSVFLALPQTPGFFQEGLLSLYVVTSMNEGIIANLQRGEGIYGQIINFYSQLNITSWYNPALITFKGMFEEELHSEPVVSFQYFRVLNTLAQKRVHQKTWATMYLTFKVGGMTASYYLVLKPLHSCLTWKYWSFTPTVEKILS